jgi:hypothetical protein
MDNNSAIKKQVSLLRKYYNISTYPDSVGCFCHECDLENYIFSLRNNLYYEQILLSKLGIDNPFHRASILGFSADYGIQWFLVDPTYGQFFQNEKFANYMFSNYKEFSLELLNNGFVECTLENIYSYMHGFMFSKAFSDNIDTKIVYNNLYNILLNMKEINDYEVKRELELKEMQTKKRKGLFNKKKKK